MYRYLESAKMESLVPSEVSSRLEQKRGATRARVRKHRAVNKTTVTERSPPMSNTERSRKRRLEKKRLRLDSQAAHQGLDQSQPNRTERSVPASSLERTRQYRLCLRRRTRYVKPKPLTKSEHNYRSYAKQKQLKLQSQLALRATGEVRDNMEIL